MPVACLSNVISSGNKEGVYRQFRQDLRDDFLRWSASPVIKTQSLLHTPVHTIYAIHKLSYQTLSIARQTLYRLNYPTNTYLSKIPSFGVWSWVASLVHNTVLSKNIFFQIFRRTHKNFIAYKINEIFKKHLC